MSAAAHSLQRCDACRCIPSYPRVRCPRCFTTLSRIDSSGTGVLVSCGIVRHTHDASYERHLPIVLAHVLLDEGVEVISTVVGADRLEAAIGRRVVIADEERWADLPQFQLDLAVGDGASSDG